MPASCYRLLIVALINIPFLWFLFSFQVSLLNLLVNLLRIVHVKWGEKVGSNAMSTSLSNGQSGETR